MLCIVLIRLLHSLLQHSQEQVQQRLVLLLLPRAVRRGGLQVLCGRGSVHVPAIPSFGTPALDAVWMSIAWHGIAWHGLAWHDTVTYATGLPCKQGAKLLISDRVLVCQTGHN